MSTFTELLNATVDTYVAAEATKATAPLTAEVTALKATVSARNETITMLTTQNATLTSTATAQVTEIAALKAEVERLKAGTPPVDPPEDPKDPPVEEEPPTPPTVDTGTILYDRARLMERPTTGKPWDLLAAMAKRGWSTPNLGDNNSQADAEVVAGALYAVRMNDAAMRDKVIKHLNTAAATPRLTRTLELGRGLFGYVQAAALIQYADKAFVDWVYAMVTRKFGDGDRWGSFDTILITALAFNSNWATQCRRSVVGAAMYLKQVGSTEQKTDADKWFKQGVEAHKRDIGVKGDYKDLPPLTTSPTGWSGDADPVVGINPRGTKKEIGGKVRDLDGARPADWLRAKGPDGKEDREAKYWPPQPVTYHWEGIGPEVVLGMVLHQQGIVPFDAADNALVRALNALYGRVPNDPPFINPASGDDRSIPWIVNYYAKENFPTNPDEMPDKAGIGFMDWYLG